MSEQEVEQVEQVLPIAYKRKAHYAPFAETYKDYKNPLSPPENRHYGFDVSPYLAGVVGSRANRDIYIKNAWQSANAFNEWKNKYPEARADYEWIEADMDKDGIDETGVKRNGRIIAINGYTTRRSEYPYRKDYYNQYPTRELRKENKIAQYWERYDPELKPNDLSATWHVKQEELDRKHIRKILKETVSPYQHFVKVIAKPAFDTARAEFANKYIKDESKREFLSVPGILFTRLCSQAWDTFIIAPIRKQKEGVEDWLKSKFAQIKSLHPDLNDAVAKERAWTALKNNKQFKEDVENVYKTFIQDEAFGNAVIAFYKEQFGPQYLALTKGEIKLKSEVHKQTIADKFADNSYLAPNRYNPFKHIKTEEINANLARLLPYRIPNQNSNLNNPGNSNQNMPSNSNISEKHPDEHDLTTRTLQELGELSDTLGQELGNLQLNLNNTSNESEKKEIRKEFNKRVQLLSQVQAAINEKSLKK